MRCSACALPAVIYGSIQPFTFALSISLGAYLLGWLYDRAEGWDGRMGAARGFFPGCVQPVRLRPYPQKLP